MANLSAESGSYLHITPNVRTEAVKQQAGDQPSDVTVQNNDA